MARGALLAIISVLLGLSWAHESKAEEGAELEIVSTKAASTCADAVILRSKIAERLGRDPFAHSSGARPSGRLTVWFAHADHAWTAKIALDDASGKRNGERTLTREGGTCGPLVTDVAFTIAVLFENLAPVEALSPPPPSPPPPSPPLEPFDPEVKAPAPAKPPERNVRVDAVIGGAGAIGGAPAPTVGGEVVVGIDAARLRVEVGGRLFLPASSDGDVAVRTRLLYGRIAPCYGLRVISACFIAAVGSLSGEAVGERIASSRIDAQIYAAGGMGVLARFFVIDDVLFIRTSVDVLFSLSRVGFDVGDQRVWTLPFVSGAGSLGIGARLP